MDTNEMLELIGEREPKRGMLDYAQGPAPQYAVVDAQTGTVVGRYSTLRRAHHAADRLDLQYGAVRYIVKPIPAPAGFARPIG